MQSDISQSLKWRELLGSLNEEERQQIINELGIRDKTLERWIQGHTMLPRSKRVHQLLTVLPPQIRIAFIESIEQDPAFSKYREEFILPSRPLGISSTFYMRVLEANSTASKNFRFTMICQLVLLQMVGQLDPDHRGLSVSILKYTSPSEGKKVRTLHQYFSLGTAPWSNVIEQKGFFMGAESVVGQAAFSQKPSVIQDTHITTSSDIHLLHADASTRSIAGIPLLRGAESAGGLLIVSTQAQFFTRNRVTLLQKYCHLLGVALADNEFYGRQQIDLHAMPSVSEQQHLLDQFRQRISTILRQRNAIRQTTSWQEAEQEVRQALEAEFLEKGDGRRGKEGKQ